MKNILLVLPFLVSWMATAPITLQSNSDIDQILVEIGNYHPSRDTVVFPLIRNIYSSSQEKPIWEGATLSKGLAFLENSRVHGLNPKDYLFQILSVRLAPDFRDSESRRYRNLATDVMMTYGMLQFTRHILEGKTDPESFYNTWNYRRVYFDQEKAIELTEAIKSDNLEAFISGILPQSNYYSALYHWMERYYEGEFDGMESLMLDSLPLKPGYTGTEIIELKYRLSQYGSYSTPYPSPEFDTEMADAVKAFQKQMGLSADGIIGRRTLEALNMSPDRKRDIIRVNMERARWLLHNLPEELLLVNIAGYELYYFRDTEKIFQTPVIVGQVHHQTPVFYADMKYIEFNCSWVVPRSIAVNEILPAIKKDPEYPAKHQIEVLRQNVVLDPGTVNWEDYSSNNMPFVFRQLPGPYNSLGRMKFIFPNDYAIYLHDTPAKYLFEAEESRAFSHGCVRVKNPIDLAELILSRQGTTHAQIDSILNEGTTTRVYLENPLPVFLTYWTVFPTFPVDINADLHWVRDIYGRDKVILKALDQ